MRNRAQVRDGKCQRETTGLVIGTREVLGLASALVVGGGVWRMGRPYESRCKAHFL